MTLRISHAFSLLPIHIIGLICMCMALVPCAIFCGTGCVGVRDGEDDCSSMADVLSSIIQIPRGETNALYYAGSSGKKTVMIHVTSTGERIWKLQMTNLDQDVIMPYTEDRSKWILLKETDGDRLRHWNWKQEIKDFIRRLPRESAIVSSDSSWFKVDDDILGGSNILWVVESFIVEATLSETLKCGDTICTERLFDGQAEELRDVLAEAHKKNVKIIGRPIVSRELKCVYWNSAKTVHKGGSLAETALCIDSEIVAPLKFHWDCIYDELLPFEEEIAISVYKKRAEEYQGGLGH